MELSRHRLAGAAAVLLLAGCVGTPSVSGVPGASPSPEVPWSPPPTAAADLARADSAATPVLPPDLGERIRRLSLAEIVELGLRNNPATREAWANAQSAAAVYGSERGAWLPSVDGDVSAARIKTTASQGRSAVQQSVLTPSVTLSYLLFDFGGRSGRVEGARQRLLSAGFTQNATIQDVVLQIQIAYFQYLANRAFLQAQQTTLAEADTNLMAAEERGGSAWPPSPTCSRPGPRRARRSSTLQTTEGRCRRHAVRWRWPSACPRICRTTWTSARRWSPVAAARRQRGVRSSPRRCGTGPTWPRPGPRPRRAAGGVGEVRASLLPALSLERDRRPDLRHHHSQRRQQLQPVARADHPDLQRVFPPVRRPRRTHSMPRRPAPGRSRCAQQVVFQVFSSYYALQTATRRVRTALDLIASAEQSSEVALGRYKRGRGHAARPARGAERARRRPGPAGGRAAVLERLAGPAGPRRRRARHPRRTPPPALDRHHDDGNAPMTRLTRSPGPRSLLALVVSACAEGPAPVSRRCRSRSAAAERRAVPFELAATGHGRADPDRGGPGAGERPDRAGRVHARARR